MRAVGEIRKAKASNEYTQILSKVNVCNEEIKVDKFLLILKKFSEDKDRKRQYVLARAMLALLTSEAREFVLKVLEDNVFGGTRLNAICRMEYFSVESSILLDYLLSIPRDSDCLEMAARTFQLHDVKELMIFAARKSPSEIIKRMKRDNVFRGDLEFQDTEICFSGERVQEFIEFLSKKLEIEVPHEARELFVRLRLEGELVQYDRGRTEFSDFFNIIVAYADGDDALLRLCVSLVAEHNNALYKFLCSMVKIPFVRNPIAEDSVPACIDNDALHNMACDRHHSLVDTSSVKEFSRQLDSAENIAVYYHQNTVGGQLKCDFVSFRVHQRIFHFSVQFSNPFKRDVIRALVRNQGKTVFVFKRELAVPNLLKSLGWNPKNLIDAKDILRGMGLVPNLNSMASAIVGGQFCGRAMNFSGKAMPSQTALRHIDIMISLIRKFCIEYYRGTDDNRGRQQQQKQLVVPSVSSDRSRSRH